MLSTLYRSLTNVFAPFVGVYLFIRRVRGREDGKRFKERFGYPSQPRPRGRVVWCHAASVGEASSLLLLMEKIHETRSEISIILTTGTVAAARMIEKRLPPYAMHQYVPVDLMPCVTRFLDTWKPMLAIWIESELWPNTLMSLRARSVPAVLLNARMSEKSFRNWSCVKGFAQELVSSFRLCLAQTEDDRRRFEDLGARPVKCIGNLKYMSSPLPFDPQELDRLREATKGRFLWLMASTHPGEEELALAAHRELALKYPHVLTVIAPRHESRGGEIEKLIRSSGLSCARRSGAEKIDGSTQIYLADTMGEMGLFYSLCPMAVLGGSFAGTGGHNPIEPAQLGSAIVFGPSMYNFSEIAQEFVSEGAACQIGGADGIASAVRRLETDDPARRRQIDAARLLADRKRSILGQIIVELTPFLK